MNPLEKSFKIPGDQIKRLITNMGACFATDRITVDGMKVGYMYREEPDKDIDSGWRFFSGDESQDYVDNAEKTSIYSVNTICNYDPAIIPFLLCNNSPSRLRSSRNADSYRQYNQHPQGRRFCVW
ncbi:MAG: DUF2185 domain-containing protein [Verrucomicrobiales bacterium]